MCSLGSVNSSYLYMLNPFQLVSTWASIILSMKRCRQTSSTVPGVWVEVFDLDQPSGYQILVVGSWQTGTSLGYIWGISWSNSYVTPLPITFSSPHSPAEELKFLLHFILAISLWRAKIRATWSFSIVVLCSLMLFIIITIKFSQSFSTPPNCSCQGWEGLIPTVWISLMCVTYVNSVFDLSQVSIIGLVLQSLQGLDLRPQLKWGYLQKILLLEF